MNDNEKFTNKLSFYINVVASKSGDNIKSVKDLVKGLRYQAVNSCTINSESPFVCLFALCSIVSQKISCIYSQRNNVTHFNTYTIIHPRELCSNPKPIAILWYPVGTAKPNHFVLCMDRSLVFKVDSIGTKRKASHLLHIPYKLKLLSEKVPTHNVIAENLEHTSSILQDVSDPLPLIHTNPLSKCNPRIKSSIKNYFSKFEFPKNPSAERDEISVEDVSPTKVKSVSHQQTSQITFSNTDRSGDKCVLSSPSCSSVKNNSKQGKVCIKECRTNPKVRGQPVKLSTECHPFDIGVNLHKISSFSNEEKVNFLSKVWIPPVDYEFPKYFANNKHWSFNRKFIEKDSKEYHHWLVYSAYYDGVFCLPCVLFGNNIARNSTLLTILFTEPFTRSNGANTRWKMHETKSPMHKAAFDDINTFISFCRKNMSVDINLSSKAKKTIAENKEK